MRHHDFEGAIDELYIGIICVHPRFDSVFKPRRPRYVVSVDKNSDTGEVLKYTRTLEYEIKLDFESVRAADEGSAVRILIKCIFDSIDNISRVKKLANFDTVFLRKSIENVFTLTGADIGEDDP